MPQIDELRYATYDEAITRNMGWIVELHNEAEPSSSRYGTYKDETMAIAAAIQFLDSEPSFDRVCTDDALSLYIAKNSQYRTQHSTLTVFSADQFRSRYKLR